jgi:hypothetical protein
MTTHPPPPYSPPQHPPAGGPPPSQHKRHRRWPWIVAGAVTLLIIIIGIANRPPATRSDTTPAVAASTSTPASSLRTPEMAFLDDIYDTPGLTSTMNNADVTEIGRQICGLIGTPGLDREEMIAQLGASKLGPDVMRVIVGAAEVNLCPVAKYAPATPEAAAPPAAISPDTITYEVTGDRVTKASITYVKDANFGQQQENSAKLPWTKTVEIESGGLGQLTSLVAQSSSGGSGSITCRILDGAGQEITSSTSSGPYAVVTCAGS